MPTVLIHPPHRAQGVSKLVCTFHEWVQTSHSSPISPSSPPTSQGNCLPNVRTQPWGAQCVALTAHAQGGSLPMQSRFSSEYSPRALLFHSSQILCGPWTALALQESFCQSPVSFQWEPFHMEMYFWRVHRRKRVLHPPTPTGLTSL